MGGATLIIAKHVACLVNKHCPDSRKENMLSLKEGKLLHTAVTEKDQKVKFFCLKVRFRTHDEDCKCVGGVTS